MAGRPLRLASLLGAFATIAALSVVGSAAATPTDKEILLSRPLAPKKVARQYPFFYPNTPPVTHATGPGPTEAEARAKLTSYLHDGYPRDADTRAAAMAVYDSTATKQKVPTPSIRAALAALEGTIGQPAIQFIVSGTTAASMPAVTSVTFADLPDNVIAESSPVGSDRVQLFLNDDYSAGNPFQFTAPLAHEALHEDNQNGSTYEELAASSFETLVYLRELVNHPELARSPTGVARFENTLATARLNSGRGTKLGLFASNKHRPVLPGSTKSYTSFYEAFDKNLVNATGNAVLAAYLANTHTPGKPKCSAAQFSRALLDCIDANRNGGLSSAQLVSAARALGLDVKP